MSDSQEEQDPVRQEILAGARELFIHFGFKKTTMEDIARKVGKSKSALYYYFKTKEEIFDAMAVADMDRQHRLAQDAMEKEETAQGRFRAFVVTVFSELYEKTKEFSIFKAELRENPLLVVHIAEKRNAYIEGLLKELLRHGISRGEVRPLTDDQIEIWARTINTCMKGIGSRLFLGNDQDIFKDHLEFIADSLFMGVATSHHTPSTRASTL